MEEKKWSQSEHQKFLGSKICQEIKKSDIRNYNFRMMLTLPDKIKDRSPEKKKKKQAKEDRFLDYLKIEENKKAFSYFPVMFYVFLRNLAIIHDNHEAFQFFHYGAVRWYRKTYFSSPLMEITINNRIFGNTPSKKIKVVRDQDAEEKKLEKIMTGIGM